MPRWSARVQPDVEAGAPPNDVPSPTRKLSVERVTRAQFDQVRDLVAKSSNGQTKADVSACGVRTRSGQSHATYYVRSLCFHASSTQGYTCHRGPTDAGVTCI